jgi:hypothetical protein
VTTVLEIGSVVVVALAGWWLWLGHRGGSADQVQAFTAARSVTNRWSEDPLSAPAPVREYLAKQQLAPSPETPAGEADAVDP